MLGWIFIAVVELVGSLIFDLFVGLFGDVVVFPRR